jgi:AraC-like DNA-binding protein
MRQSCDFSGTPQLDFEAWRTFIRSGVGDVAEVAEPNAFAAWMRHLNTCGFAGSALKIQSGVATTESSGHAYRSERTPRDVRRAGADWYYAVFQVAERSAIAQNDRTVQLAVGDVALFDAARPASCFASDAQWLGLQLPRRSLVSHLGFEPRGGLHASGGTRIARLLHQLVLDGLEEEETISGPARPYMQLAFYDLLGALFASSDPWPISRYTDKLFTRIRGLIRDRFANPDFGPAAVAAESGISLRYVQKLFTARESTCSEYIYALRLDHAARLLHRRALLDTGQPLSEIAHACGFRDYVHFARKFRRRFGYAPSAHATGDVCTVGAVRAGAGEGAFLAHDLAPISGQTRLQHRSSVVAYEADG